VPKGHYETLVDLPAWLVGPLFQNAQLSSETWQLGSQTVWVSHLEKLYWPQVKFTKGDN
jgi:hypothetical protein